MELATETNRRGLTGLWKRLRGRLRDDWFSWRERRLVEDRLCFDVEQLEQRVLLSATLTGSANVDEGAPYSLTLNHAGENVDYWDIDWGDGILQKVQGPIADGVDKGIEHTYADGTQARSIAATAHLAGGGVANANKAVTVNDVIPSIALDGATTAAPNETYKLFLLYDDPGDDSVTGWEIDWGDDSFGGTGIQTITGRPNMVEHVFEPSVTDYTITAQVTNDDGTFSSTNSISVDVSVGSISGVAYHDLNGNGQRDIFFEGDRPVVLFVVDMSGSMDDPLASSVPYTDLSGNGTSDERIDAALAAFENLQQNLINQGFASVGGIGFVTFNAQGSGKIVDWDHDAGETQFLVPIDTPLTDLTGAEPENNPFYSPINSTYYSEGLGEAADWFDLQEVTDLNGDLNLIFLTDGDPTDNSTVYEPLADDLRNMEVHMRAFGMIDGNLAALTPIDPTALIYSDVDELVVDFGQGASGGEPALPNWTVYIDENRNAQHDPGEPFTITDGVGAYEFSDLKPGTYMVREELQSGWRQTEPRSVAYEITVGSDGASFGDSNFGNLRHNQRPIFTSNPVETIILGKDYYYDADATDPDGDDAAITYTLTGGHPQMTIDADSGEITWVTNGASPSITADYYSVVVTATDEAGGFTNQPFSVQVQPSGPPNRQPRLVADPPTDAYIATPYTYDFDAVDPDGDDISFELLSTPAGFGLTSDGLASWTPSIRESMVYSTLGFNEDFDDGSLDGITLSDANGWSFNDNLLVSNASETDLVLGTVDTSGAFPHALPSAFQVGGTLRIGDGGTNQTAVLIFDYESTTDDFKFARADATAGQWQLGHYDHATTTWTVDDSYDATIALDNNYNVTIAVEGSRADLFVDGYRVLVHFFAGETTMNGGQVGFAAKQTEAYLDDFHVASSLWPVFLGYDFVDDLARTVSYTEKFFDGVADGFIEQSGTWKTDSKTYGSSDADALVTLNLVDALPRRFTFDATVNIAAAETGILNEHARLIFDYQSAADYKFIEIDAAADSAIIGEVVSGVRTDLATATGLTIDTGTEYVIQLAVDGESVSASIDGTVVKSHVFAADVNGGALGLGADESGAQFDDVRVAADLYVELIAKDPAGLADDFEYPILLHPAAENHAPRIINTAPGTHILVGDPPITIGDVTPDVISLELGPGETIRTSLVADLPGPDVEVNVVFVVNEGGFFSSHLDAVAEFIEDTVNEHSAVANTTFSYGIVGHGGQNDGLATEDQIRKILIDGKQTVTSQEMLNFVDDILTGQIDPFDGDGLFYQNVYDTLDLAFAEYYDPFKSNVFIVMDNIVGAIVTDGNSDAQYHVLRVGDAIESDFLEVVDFMSDYPNTRLDLFLTNNAIMSQDPSSLSNKLTITSDTDPTVPYEPWGLSISYEDVGTTNVIYADGSGGIIDAGPGSIDGDHPYTGAVVASSLVPGTVVVDQLVDFGTDPVLISDPVVTYDYVELVEATRGTVWDLIPAIDHYFVAPDPDPRFQESVMMAIESQWNDFTQTPIQDAVVRGTTGSEGILTVVGTQPIPVEDGQVAVDMTFTGDGGAHRFDIDIFEDGGIGRTIASVPVVINGAYLHDVDAVDADGDTLTYKLLDAPQGASINSETGEIRWTPRELGTNFAFEVQVSDGRGGYDEYAWTVDVIEDSGSNPSNPQFDGLPTEFPTAMVGLPYMVDLDASDADGDTVRFFLVNDPGAGKTVPAGMSVGLMDGKLRWSPQFHQAGAEHTVHVRISDGRGGTTETSIDIQVELQPANDWPVIQTPTGELTAIAHNELHPLLAYQVDATDADNDALTYTLKMGPEGLAIDSKTGLIAWDPTGAEDGFHNVVVHVRDGRGGVDQEFFTVQLELNNQPAIEALPSESLPADVEVVAGATFSQTFVATDLDAFDTDFEFSTDWFSSDRGVTVTPVSATSNQATLSWTTSASDIGVHEVLLFATDGRGGVGLHAFTLRVKESGGSNDAPVIPAQSYRSDAFVGVPYVMQVEATDPDHDRLYFSIDGALTTDAVGTTIDEDLGLISWTPDLDDLDTPHDIVVIVRDRESGGLTATRTFTVTPLASADNTEPEIELEPCENYHPGIDLTGQIGNRRAIVGEVFEEILSATDEDGDVVFWRLEDGPGGMWIDASSGRLVWEPTGNQVGTHDVTVRVLDVYGGSISETFKIEARGANVEPQIVSVAPTEAKEGYEYKYVVRAIDPDGCGQYLTFDVTDAPAGMDITHFSDPETGERWAEVTWTPPVSGPSTQSFNVTVSDRFGAMDVEPVTIDVYGPAVDLAPIIRNVPPARAYVTNTYTYKFSIEAEDPDGDDANLSYAVVSQPAGENMAYSAGTDEFIWVPATEGLHTFEISVADATTTVVYVFTVDTEDMTAYNFSKVPEVVVLPGPFDVFVGQPFELQAIAPNQIGREVTWEIDSASEALGIEIDPQDGRITWTPSAAVSGHILSITATNDFGNTSSAETVTLNAIADTENPEVTLEATRTGVMPNTTVEFLVSSRDNFGVDYTELTINDTAVDLGRGGNASYNFTTPGSYSVVATATDVAGNTGTSSPLTITVYDPAVDDLPSLSLSILDRQVIDATTPVVATISDSDGISSYELSYRAVDQDIWTVLSTGSGSITDSTLATLVPISMRDGVYMLRLTATDGDTPALTDFIERTFVVERGLAGRPKLGDFSMSFTDMTVPIAGVPLTVQRTYDTLGSSASGDFGFGWRLDLFGTSVMIDTHGLTSSGLGEFLPPLRTGSKFVVTLPGGSRETFLFSAEPLDVNDFGLGNIPGAELAAQLLAYAGGIVQPKIIAAPGSRNTLEFTGQAVSIVLDGEGQAFVGKEFPFNPALPFSGVTGYVLTTVDGTKYYLNAVDGSLERIVDRHGNILTVKVGGDVQAVNADGVETAALEIERDAHGRIHSITDPEGGSYLYRYSPDGDLVEVIDRVNSANYLAGAAYESTKITYRDDRPHFLKAVTDARGVDVVEVDFDSNGLLKGIDDATGAGIDFDFTEDVSGFLQGHTVERVREMREGSLINTPLSSDVRLVRNADGNVVRRIERTDYEADVQATYRVTVFEYYDNGYQKRESEAFEVIDDLTIGTDDQDIYTAGGPTGGSVVWLSETEYDERGFIRSTRDALGNVSAFSFDDYGSLLQSTDPAGGVTKNRYDLDTGALIDTRQILDDGSAITTRYDYDSRGNLSAVVPVVDGVKLTPTSTFIYDEYGYLKTVTETNDPGIIDDDVVQTFKYDRLGNQIESTTIRKDATGTSRTITSITRYDEEGRVDGSSQEVDAVEQWSTSTAYTTTGLVEQTTNRFGNISQNIYDVRGNLIESRTQVRDETETLMWLVSRTVYDEQGREEYSVDPHIESDPDTTPLAAPGGQFLYDALGRVSDSIRLKNLLIEVVDDTSGVSAGFKTARVASGSAHSELSRSTSVYDPAGRVIRTDSALGSTWFEYDLAGRQTALITDTGDAAVAVYPRVEYEYDPAGRQILVRDNLHQSDPLDNLTIVGAGARERHFQFDALGRQIAVLSPLFDDGSGTLVHARTETVFDERGRRAGVIENITQEFYQNPASVDRSEARRTSYEYDDNGRMRAAILPLAPVPGTTDSVHPRYEYVYDDFGNQVGIHDSLNQTSLLGSVNYNDQRTTQFTFDHLGRQRARILPLGVVAGDGRFTEWMIYDDQPLANVPSSELSSSTALGQVAIQVDFEGNLTQYLYDNTATGQGKLIAKRYFEAGDVATIVSGIHAATTAASVQSSLATLTPIETVDYIYDAFGRAYQTVTDPFAKVPANPDRIRTTTYTYDEYGNILTEDSPEGILHYEYNNVTGQLTRTHTAQPEAPSTIVTDTLNRYDDLGRLEEVEVVRRNGVAVTGEITTYQYDTIGRIDSISVPNDVITMYTYTPLDQVERIEHFTDVNANGVYDDGTDDRVMTFEYTYSSEGQRSSETTRDYSSGEEKVSTFAWEYDRLGRLEEEIHANSKDTLESYTTTFTYDLVGNRLAKSVDYTNDDVRDILFEYEYDANDRLVLEKETPQSLTTSSLLKDHTTNSTRHGQLIKNGSPEVPRFAAGKLGESLLMDDWKESVDVTETAGEALVAGEYTERTVSMWIKAEDGLGGWHNLYDEGDENSGFTIRYHPTYYESTTNEGLLMVRVRHDNDNQDNDDYTYKNYRIDADARYDWLHIVAVYDATATTTTEVLIYVNNKEDGWGGGDTDNVPGETNPDVRELTFGARIIGDTFGGGTGVYFLGQIDEVRIYDRALAPADVAQLYKLDDVTNGLIGHWTMDGVETASTRYFYGPQGAIANDVGTGAMNSGVGTTLTHQVRYTPDAADPTEPLASGAITLEEKNYYYDARGRMVLSWLDRNGDGLPESIDGYDYDDSGQRIRSGSIVLVGDMNMDLVMNSFDVSPFETGLSDPATYLEQYGVDPDFNGDVDGSGGLNSWDVSPFETLLEANLGGPVSLEMRWIPGGKRYLNTSINATGYAQALEVYGYEKNLTTNELEPVLELTYTLGHDVIGQASTDAVTADETVIAAGEFVTFVHDAHGSVRAVMDMQATPNVLQVYTYTAYGLAIGFNAAVALTTLQYSGEQFDIDTGWQYLRARYYDPRNGRFTRMDPWAGSINNPLTLHKYGYVHGNPIGGIDPSGLISLSENSFVAATQATLFTLNVVGAYTSFKASFEYGAAAWNAFRGGDFWAGVAYASAAALNGAAGGLSLLGAFVSLKVPPPFLGGGAALAFAGGGQSSAVIWTAITANPALGRWVVSTVGPLAFTVFMQAQNGGVPAQNHHKVPHGNSTYDLQNHPLVKRASADLKNDPRNQMLLANHQGRHAGSYLDEVWNRLEKSWRALLNRTNSSPTKLQADRALGKVFRDIETDIGNGTLRPYDNKDVWIP